MASHSLVSALDLWTGYEHPCHARSGINASSSPRSTRTLGRVERWPTCLILCSDEPDSSQATDILIDGGWCALRSFRS